MGPTFWVTGLYGDIVTEIEASTGTVIREIPLGSAVGDVSSDGTHVWVAKELEETVTEIEASTGTVVREIPVGSRPGSISSDGTHVWVGLARSVAEIEASSGAVIRTIHVGYEGANGVEGVSSDGTDVWVANFVRTVTEILVNGPAPVCTGNSGTVTLSPGLTDTATLQTIKLRGSLTGCTDAPFLKPWFTGATYKATLKTAGPVSCSALTGAGAPATGIPTFKWTPKAKTSMGTLSMPLTETPDVLFAGELTSGSYSPQTLLGTVTESYTGGATCGEAVGKTAAKAVKKGTFSGSTISFSFE